MTLDAVIYAHIYTHLKRLVTVKVLRWVCGTRQTQTKTHAHTLLPEIILLLKEKRGKKNAAFVPESPCCVFFFSWCLWVALCGAMLITT